MAEISLGIRVLTGQDLRPRVVRFRHPAPRRSSTSTGASSAARWPSGSAHRAGARRRCLRHADAARQRGVLRHLRGAGGAGAGPAPGRRRCVGERARGRAGRPRLGRLHAGRHGTRPRASARARCSAGWKRRGHRSRPSWTLFDASSPAPISTGACPSRRSPRCSATPTPPRFTTRFVAGPGRPPRTRRPRRATHAAPLTARAEILMTRASSKPAPAAPVRVPAMKPKPVAVPARPADGVYAYFALACAITWTMALPAALAWSITKSPRPWPSPARD